MTNATASTTCACSGTDCGWISHAPGGERCENTFDGERVPPGWSFVQAEGPCCPSCVAIRGLHAAMPLPPFRWIRESARFADFLV